jgi:hypothetical protein
MLLSVWCIQNLSSNNDHGAKPSNFGIFVSCTRICWQCVQNIGHHTMNEDEGLPMRTLLSVVLYASLFLKRKWEENSFFFFKSKIKFLGQ